MTMRVGVTGASGQVGAALVQRLYDEGIYVVASVRNMLGAALVHASTPHCDIRVGPVAQLLDDCDVIINCALASGDGHPRQAYTRNRELVDGLLQARSLRRLLHFSTVAVYGELIRDGTRAARPNSEYGRSKLYVEQYAVRRARSRGIRCSILRLGHVYGAGIGRSREIIELARNPRFRLPYGGRLQSNAIHIDRLAAAIAELLATEESAEVYSLAEPQSTWRDVFDWHTESVGLTPVASMSDAISDLGRDAYAKRSLVRDISGWVRALPIKQLLRSPAVLDLALRTMVKTPAAATRRLSDAHRRLAVRKHVAHVIDGPSEMLSPIYYSAGMPGTFLPIPGDPVGADTTRRERLDDWYRRWSTPKIHNQTLAFARRRERERS